VGSFSRVLSHLAVSATATGGNAVGSAYPVTEAPGEITRSPGPSWVGEGDGIRHTGGVILPAHVKRSGVKRICG
jgi:hypothetical protein